ncbi:methyl-accepting chemotaxis protein [Neobacillus thermocopriae]|uniref:methyl-accepting chemotaxis protein n=1 Tax=Neobacillus thermocopriae TaxID=1215031 RepID=UPI002E2342C9|nr:methyl-accepting chemotaxis protein [Neobacillus thermocopriae]MED3713796.1 methyl-accepting chemotaxis protein [Neobacillus thermocopriae]
MKIDNQQKQRFTLNSAKTKLIVTMLAIVMIPTILIAILSNAITQKVTHEQTASSTLEVTKLASSSLDNKIDGVVSQLTLLANNDNFTEFDQQDGKSTDGYHLLKEVLKTNKDYAFVYFGSMKKDMLSAPNSELPEDYDPTERDWYKGAAEKDGKVYYSEPYQDEGTGQMVLTLSQAVKDKNGQLVGVVAIDLDMGQFSKSLSEIKVGKEGFLTLIGEDGKYIYHPNSKLIGSDQLTKLSIWNQVKEEKEGYGEFELNGGKYFSTYMTNQQTGWKFVTQMDRSEIFETADKVRNMSWLLSAIFAFVSALAGYWISRRIANNILVVKDALETASKGDFTARVSVKTKDEFKELEQSFNHMMEQLSTSLQKVGNTSKSVLETSAHLSVMTRETNTALSEVAIAIEEIAQGAGLQAKNVQVGYDSMKGLSQQLDEIHGVTENMNDVSRQSMKLSNKGLEQVGVLTEKALETKSSTNEVTSIIKEVDRKMEEINTIIEAITKITDQTNLLSLNASIESARAGEHGKGFAVVANEVRKLAEQSKASAEEIKKIVDNIKAVVKNAVEAMERTNRAVTEQDIAVTETKTIFHEILVAIRDLAEKVEEVEASIKESQSNKETINQEMDSITAVSEQTAAATEEVSASTEEISVTMNNFTQHASGLKELAEQLDEEIHKFKLS